MKISAITLTLLLILTISYSCSEKKEIEPFNVPGIKTTASRILISPLAFDGAVVAITGNIKDILITDDNSSPNQLILTDEYNTDINVEFKDDFDGLPDEFILVSGKFVKELNKITDAKLYRIIIEDGTIKPLNNW